MDKFDAMLVLSAWDGNFEHEINLMVKIHPKACAFENVTGHLMFEVDGEDFSIYDSLTVGIVKVKEVWVDGKQI